MTDVPTAEVEEICRSSESDELNPMDLKKRLAREIVGQFHDASVVSEAENHFERVIQRREAPEDIMTIGLNGIRNERLSRILVVAGLVDGTTAAKRLIAQGAVTRNGQKMNLDAVIENLELGDIIKAGRLKYIQVVE